MKGLSLIYVYVSNWSVGVDISVWVLVAFFLIALLLVLFKGFSFLTDWLSPEVEISVPLGGFGSVKIKADHTVSQIAYTAWAELITRKAGLPIDIENDVIADIYRSWYQMFDKMRELLKTVPAYKLKKENTRILVRLLTKTLNDGLRPHLTLWQARFNAWYSNELIKETNKGKSPQALQKEFPQYAELLADLIVINQQLVGYAEELKRLVKLED